MIKKKLDANQFNDINIAVLGDLILDKYIFGKVERISPEAPIPIVSVEKENFALGGAANVAANIASLHANSYLLGILGNDSAKEKFILRANALKIDTKGILIDNDKSTIQKIRIIGQHQQLLRIDYEDGNYIEESVSDFFIEKLKDIPSLDAIILSDYAKGTISSDLSERIFSFAKIGNIPVIVDPKPKHKIFYKGADLITPNLKEAKEITGIHVNSIKDLENCGKKLNDIFQCDIIITTGEKGMSVFPFSGNIEHIPTHATEVFDVSGAGDTVIATLTLAKCSHFNLSDAAKLANIAAGIKVKKLGTAPVKITELIQSFQSE